MVVLVVVSIFVSTCYLGRMKRYQDIFEEILVDTNIAESTVEYSVGAKNPFIDPLVDWAFKRIFASEANASTMTKEPVFAEEMGAFFESARCAKFTKEELEMYRTAQQEEWDNQNALDYAKEKAMKEGLEQGRELGREVGVLTKAIEIALEMIMQGFDLAKIANITKLSKEQIQELY